MDFVDEVRTRSGRFAGRVKHWESEPPTEEGTKTSLILPFIQMLGYDIFDPTEVVPEFTADIGIKRGEKVDYAIMQRGKPAILIECKKYGSGLAEDAVSQLVRYFGVTNAHFGILTDGISYRFFSDLDQPNVMDPKPFFEFRDTKSYSMILLDNSNRTPILRLYFNSPSKKKIGLPGEGRDSYGRRNILEYPIESVDEITGYADQIRDVARRYLKEDGDPRELA